MPAGACPECGNLVALSATRCPRCGNRQFLKRTKSYFVICSQCDGAGTKYDVVNFKITEQQCAGCSGTGVRSEYQTYDCRDPDEAEYIISEANRSKDLEPQVRKEALSEEKLRDAKFGAEASLRLKKWIEGGELKKVARKRAGGQIITAIKLALLFYVIVGFGGCNVRMFNSMDSTISQHYSSTNAHAFIDKWWGIGLTAYMEEAVYASLIVIALGLFVAVLTVIIPRK
jgi:hypothetical protein